MTSQQPVHPSPSLSTISTDSHQSSTTSMLPPAVNLRINSDTQNSDKTHITHKTESHEPSISSFFADSPRTTSLHHSNHPYTPINNYALLHNSVPMTPTHNTVTALSTPTHVSKNMISNELLSPANNKSLIDPLLDINRCVWVERTVRDRVIWWPAQVTSILGHNTVVPRLTLTYLGQKPDTVTVFADTVHPFVAHLDQYANNSVGRQHGGLDFMDAVTAGIDIEDKYTSTNNNENGHTDEYTNKNDDIDFNEIGVQIHPINNTYKHSIDTTDESHNSTNEQSDPIDSNNNTPTYIANSTQPSVGNWATTAFQQSTPSQQQTTPTQTAAQRAANDISNIVKGSRIRIRNTDQIHHKLRDFALTEAEITDVPVHPNTWYGVRLCDGTELKLRKSAFDLLGEGTTPLPFNGPAAYVPGQFLLSSVTPPRAPQSYLPVGSKVVLQKSEETEPYPVLIGQHATIVEQPNTESNTNVYALQLTNGHVIQLPRQAFIPAEATTQTENNTLVPATTSPNNADSFNTTFNSPTPPDISAWLLNQPVRITHGLGEGTHGIVQSVIGDAISINIGNTGTISKRLDQVQVLVDASTQAAYYAYLQQQQMSQLNLQRPTALNITDNNMSINAFTNTLSPSHVSKFGHQLQIRPRNNNRQLLGKYVSVLSGRMKNQIGLVTRGANGYFTVKFIRHFDSLNDHDNSIMKRSSDLQHIIIPPDMTAEQFAERLYQQNQDLHSSMDEYQTHSTDTTQQYIDYDDDTITLSASKRRRTSPSKTPSPGKTRSPDVNGKPKRDEATAANVLLDIFQKSTPTPKSAAEAKKRDWPVAGTQLDELDTVDKQLHSTTPSLSQSNTPNKLGTHDYDAHLNLVTPRNTTDALHLSETEYNPPSAKSNDLNSTSSIDTTVEQIHRSQSPSPSIHAPTSNTKRLSYDHIPTNNSNAGNNVLHTQNNHNNTNGMNKPILSINTDENIPNLEHLPPTSTSPESLSLNSTTPDNTTGYQQHQFNAFTPSNLFASPDKKIGSLHNTQHKSYAV